MRTMKNLTITVDDAVLDCARVEAARRGTSVSRMVGEVLADLQRREDAYARAHQSWRNEARDWQAGESTEAILKGSMRQSPFIDEREPGNTAGQ